MKKYSAYKDSGIEWIGEIPEGWEVKRMKFIINEMISGPFGSSLKKDDYTNSGYKIYGQEQVIKGDIHFGKYYISKIKYEDMFRYSIAKNDILISCVGTFGKILLVPSVFEEGIINPRLIKINPDVTLINPKYLEAVLKSELISTQFESLSRGGTMGVINLDLLKRLIFAIPPLQEQTTIANYLDRKTTEIDTLIEKKKQLIVLYKEERTATINHAVTKGLDPNVPMKDSGVDWIGKIPEHWQVKRLKYCINDIFLGLTGKVDYVEDKNQGVPLIRAGNLAGGKVTLDDVRYISFTQHEQLTKYRKVQKGDVLVTKSGSIGVCAILPFNGEFSLYESVFAIRTKDEILNNELLLFILNSHMLKHQYTAQLAGMGVHHLNMGDMKNTIVIIPPLEEQPELIAKTKHRLDSWNTCISKTEKEIELLQEYKTALISEVVLGKVDVREEKLSEQDF